MDEFYGDFNLIYLNTILKKAYTKFQQQLSFFCSMF